MTKTETAASETAVDDAASQDFDIASADYRDEAEMTVVIGGKLTNWTWRFAGPGHSRTVEYNERQGRDRLHREAMQEQARVNGKKWKAPEESVSEVRERNIEWILSRLLGWSPVKFSGQDYPFTVENAKALLLDPKKPFLTQAVEFLADEASFTPRSVRN